MNWLNGVTDFGQTPGILQGATATRPAAGLLGRLFVDTSTNTWQRDTGATWVDLGVSAASAWVNGGNSFGATAVFGTIDAFGINVITSNVVRGHYRSTGELLWGTTTPSSFAAKFEVENDGVGFAAFFNGGVAIKGTGAGEMYLYQGAAYARHFYNGMYSIATSADVNFDFRPGGVLRMRLVNTNGHLLVGNPIPADTGGFLNVGGDISTSDPGSGIGKWQLGKKIAAAVVLDAANYVETKIDGVTVKLAIVV